jgi:hypothetical protein
MSSRCETVYESPFTKERVTVHVPLEDRLETDNIRKELHLEEWVDLEDPLVRRCAVAIWATSQGAEMVRAGVSHDTPDALNVKAFGGVGFRFTVPMSNYPGPFKRRLEDADYITSRADASRFMALLTRLDQMAGSRYLHFLVKEDQQYNGLREGHRYRVRVVDQGEDGSLKTGFSEIFTDRLDFCHRIDVGGHLTAPGPSLPLSVLVLSKCQFIKRVARREVRDELEHRVVARLGTNYVAIGMEQKDIVDVAAACADSTVYESKLKPFFLSLMERQHWTMRRTVLLNLRNTTAISHVLEERGVQEQLSDSILERIAILADLVESTGPVRPRLRERRSRIWWQEVEES